MAHIPTNMGDFLKDAANNLRESNLGSLSKTPALAQGGTVENTGYAKVDAGEFYFGKDSAQYVKEMGENTKKTNELLQILTSQRSNSQPQTIAASSIIMDNVTLGKVMFSSFDNNQYSKFDRVNLFS
jgi:hypothetical protein